MEWELRAMPNKAKTEATSETRSQAESAASNPTETKDQLHLDANAGSRRQLDTIDHVAVSVNNVQETVDWYSKNFDCTVKYQDATWALVEFANIRLAFVLPEQHPPHFALLGDPAKYGEPKTHRDGTRSVYVKDPSGNNIEILALK